MKNKVLLATLISTLIVPGIFLASPTYAQYVGICSGEKLIYAQDVRFAPGRDNDTAIIKDRDGNVLARLKQKSDDYVYWPANYEIPVFAGESLQYRGSGHDLLTADLLDANRGAAQKLTFKNSASINIAQTGFLRFNAGEKAREYNYLVVCPSVSPAPQPPIYQPPVYNPPVYSPPVYNSPVYNPPIYNSPGYQPVVYQYPAYQYPAYQYYSYPNQPPYFFLVPDQSVQAGRVVQFNIYAADPNGDLLTYSVSTMPVGASFNSSDRIFSWVPGKNQVGRHTIIFVVSDGTNRADMNVYIDVLPGEGNGPINYVASAVVNTGGGLDGLYQQLIGLQASVISLLQNRSNVTVIAAPVAVVTEKLKIANIRIDRQSGGNVIVSWDTNKPASSGALYDVISKADVAKDYGSAYAQSIPADYNLVTAHQINIGKLQSGATYYLRVISQAGDELVVSSERSLVVLSSTAWTIFNPWLIMLVLLILLAIVVVVLRK